VDEADAKVVIDALVSACWLRLKVENFAPLRGRPALRWEVNSLLPEIPEKPESCSGRQPERDLSGVAGICGTQQGGPERNGPPRPRVTPSPPAPPPVCLLRAPRPPRPPALGAAGDSLDALK